MIGVRPRLSTRNARYADACNGCYMDAEESPRAGSPVGGFICISLLTLHLQWSGRLDLNQRPPAPEAGALPGYATPRRTRHSLIPRRSRGRAQKDSNLQPSDP